MSDERRCSSCGVALPANAPLGLCVRCLLGAGMAGADPSAEPPDRPAAVSSDAEKPGDRIGPYKLLEKIGEGGMGTVWMAEQSEPIRRRVALKVIKQGMDSSQVLARFEAERQALALMDHPNIAKIFDAGMTGGPHATSGHPLPSDGRGAGGEGEGNANPPLSTPYPRLPSGRPYFVMELVKGIRLTKFCDERRLSIRERLELFMPVCQAIQHAHQKGIIHRDISPSNVLVALYDGRPVPKVIDFGIAKAVGQQLTERTLFTGFGAIIGKLEYMSPEQAELNQLDIDTRSDIYSLGVLLYELLTGSTPLTRETLRQAAFDEVLRRIRTEEPPRPSTRLSESKEKLPSISAQRQLDPAHLAKLIRGDLDWIVMKSLEKDRTRRYETANGLALDIQCHLEDAPVVARPPSNFYRFQKLVRRNKLAFAAGSAVAAAVVIGLGVTTWALFKRQEETANKLRALHHASVAQQGAEAAQKTAEAEKTRAETLALEKRMTRSASDLAQAAHLISLDQAREALSYLVRSLRMYPSNEAAVTRLATVLTHRSWMMPFASIHLSNAVSSAEFSPDGQWILTASRDHTARLWEAPSAELVRMFLHKGPVNSAQFSPNGRRIVTASDDRTAQIWDAGTGHPLRTLAQDGKVRWATFAPDGSRVVTSSEDTTARVWDAETGEPLGPPLKHARSVKSAQFKPDGTEIVTVLDWNEEVHRWNTRTGEKLPMTWRHKAPVRSAQFSPDGEKLIVTLWDKTVRVWDVDSSKSVVFPVKHSDVVASVQFSPDGKRLVTASRDFTLRVVDAESGQPMGEPMFHGAELLSARFSPDGAKVVSASLDGSVLVWDVRRSLALPGILRHGDWVGTARFSLDGKQIVTASGDKTARVWDAATGRQLIEARHSQPVNPAQFSPDGKKFVTSPWDGTSRIWDSKTGAQLLELRHGGARFSPDGTLIATVSSKHAAHVWDSVTGREISSTRPQGGPVECVQFSPDGQRLVTATQNGYARVWDARTGQPVTERLRHDHWTWCAEFSPDGKRVVTGSDDNTAKVWDAQTGSQLLRLEHQSRVSMAKFSPDGTRIVTACHDGTARLWDARSGRHVTMPLKHEAVVNAAQFSSDGSRVITSSDDGTARVWDVRSGLLLTEPLRHRRRVQWAEFAPSGTRALTASDDGEARVWDLAPAWRNYPAWLLELAEAISGQALTERDLLEPAPAGRADIVQNLRTKMEESLGDDWSKWGRWFLADRSTRTISPFSEFTTPEYIETRIQDNAQESLAEAEQLAVANAALIERIGKVRALTGHLNGARVLRDQGKLAEAEKAYWDVLATGQGLWTNNSMWVQQTVGELADVLQRHPEDTKVEDLFGHFLTPDKHANPEYAGLFRWRGDFRARRGRWKESAADYARFVEMDSADDWSWSLLAALLANIGDLPAYQRHCRSMLAQFDSTGSHFIAEHAARACSLLPLTGHELELSRKQGERAVSLSPDAYALRWSQFAKGLAEYRVGAFGTAADLMQTVLKKAGENINRDAHAYLVLAMARHRLQQPGEALAALAIGVELTETKLPQIDSDSSRIGNGWHELLIARVLMREAVALIGLVPPPSPAPVSPQRPPASQTLQLPILTGIMSLQDPGAERLLLALVEKGATRTWDNWMAEGERHEDCEIVRVSPETGAVAVRDVAKNQVIELRLPDGDPGQRTAPALQLQRASWPAVMELYQTLVKRTVLRPPSLGLTNLDLTLRTSTRAETAAALERLFATNGLVVEHRSRKFTFVVPASQASVLKEIPQPPSDPPVPAPPGTDLFPPGMLKFPEHESGQVLEIWQELTGRTVIRPSVFGPGRISLLSATELSRDQAQWVLGAALRLAGVDVVLEADKFAFTVAPTRTNAIPRFDRQAALSNVITRMDQRQTLRLVDVDMPKLSEAYTSVTGRQPAPQTGDARPLRFTVRTQTDCDQAEAIYLLEAVAWANGCRFENVGTNQFRLVAPPPSVIPTRPARNIRTRAEATVREELAAKRKELGNENETVARLLSELGGILVRTNQPAAAEGLYREALAINRKVWTNDAAKIQRNILELAGLWQQQGKSNEVEQLLNEFLTSGTKGKPGTVGLLQWRGNFRARLASWGNATMDFREVLENNSNDPANWSILAPLLIQQGDLEAYRAHRNYMLARFRSVTNAYSTERVARAALLLPLEGNGLAVASQLAQTSVTLGTNLPTTFAERLQGIVQRASAGQTNSAPAPATIVTNAGGRSPFVDRLRQAVGMEGTNASRPAVVGLRDYTGRSAFLFTKGLAEYREGRFASAVGWMDRVRAELNAATPSALAAQVCFVEAMSLHRQQQIDKSRELVVRGVEIVQSRLPKLDGGNLGAEWEQVVIAHILMREAQGLIGK